MSMIPYLPDELQVVVTNIKDPAKVSDLVASNLNISIEEKQDLLNTIDIRSRLEKLSAILNREIELLEIGQKIQGQVQTELNKNQKEFYLRQQMKAIQKELGEGDPRSAEVEDPSASDLYRVGVVGRIIQIARQPNGTARILVEGISRIAKLATG